MASRHPPPLPFVLCFLAGISLGAAAQASRLEQGIEDFRNGRWDDALAAFQQAAADPADASLKPDAVLWSAKTRLAAGKLPEAAADLDTYLASWPDRAGYEEAFFLKGRVLSQLGELELSVQALQSFIDRYPSSAFAASAWFWAGESLYGLGRLDEAQAAYQKVTRDWPDSARAEAAQQKISLVGLERRAQELARLLQWSHEEFLRSSEDFQRREKALKQAVESYQKKLAASGTAGLEQTIETLRAELKAKDAEIARLRSEAGSSEAAAAGPSAAGPSAAASEGAATGAAAGGATTEGASPGATSSETTAAASAAPASASSLAQATQRLLAAKLDALALKERILAWLQAQGGAK